MSRRGCYFCTCKHIGEALTYLMNYRLTGDYLSFWLAVGHMGEAAEESMYPPDEQGAKCPQISSLIFKEMIELEVEPKLYNPNLMAILEMVDLLKNNNEVELQRQKSQPEHETFKWKRYVAQAYILDKESRFGYPLHQYLAIGKLDIVETELYQKHPHIAEMINTERKLMEKQEHFPAILDILSAMRQL